MVLTDNPGVSIGPSKCRHAGIFPYVCYFLRGSTALTRVWISTYELRGVGKHLVQTIPNSFEVSVRFTAYKQVVTQRLAL